MSWIHVHDSFVLSVFTDSTESLAEIIHRKLEQYDYVDFKQDGRIKSRKVTKFCIGRGILNYRYMDTTITSDDVQHLKALFEERRKEANGGYHTMFMFAMGTGNARTKCSQMTLLEKYTDHSLLKREDEIAIKLKAREEAENICFVLYACFRFERPNHGLPPQYRSELCDIGNEVTVRAAADKLQRHIDSLLKEYEEFEQPKERIKYDSIKQFYIGKSYAVKNPSAKDFDRMNIETWDTTGFRGRWKSHKTTFKVMILLAAVTEECLPRDAREAHEMEFYRRKSYLTEHYTLSIEQSLISHYLFEQPDARLANEGVKTGETSKATQDKKHQYFLLYMCLDYVSSYIY